MIGFEPALTAVCIIYFIYMHHKVPIHFRWKQKIVTARFLMCAAILFCFCGKEVVKQTVVQQRGHDIVKTEKRDTVGYDISFGDTFDRSRFVAQFERLVKSYPFERDSAKKGGYFHLALASSVPPCPPEQRPAAAETLKQEAPGLTQQKETIAARPGGSVTVYANRGVIDHAMAGLVSCLPFAKETCKKAQGAEWAEYLDVKNASDREVALSISDKCVNAEGRRLSSFDFVNIWTDFIKKNPAEGVALFDRLKGLDGFIAGREAIVTGFVIKDEKTILLQYERPAPDAVERLCTPRLLVAGLALGPYFIKNAKNRTVVLFPNQHFEGQKAFLSSLTLKLGGDNNPFLSFSVNRYDIAMLLFVKDLEFARRKADDRSQLVTFSEDRYFLSCRCEPADLRQAVRDLIDPRDILANFVKAEGAVLSRIETDDADNSAAPPQPQKRPALPAAAAPLSVLYRADDPVSAVIAEKILADLTRNGLAANVKPVSPEEYERALVRGDYGIAAGWVGRAIISDQSERLRCASLWFTGDSDERERIAQCREIPLFSVKGYLLLKKKVHFADDRIGSVFLGD
jgi:hypothetical protein